MLRQRALDERRDVGAGVADRLQAIGRVQATHEPGNPIRENLPGIIGPHPGHVSTECCGSLQVTVRVGGPPGTLPPRVRRPPAGAGRGGGRGLNQPRPGR